MRGDLIRILNKLAKRRNKFDHVLIETTGEACSQAGPAEVELRPRRLPWAAGEVCVAATRQARATLLSKGLTRSRLVPKLCPQACRRTPSLCPTAHLCTAAAAGMADPAPVLQTFFVDSELQEAYSLDAVITVVDAKHIVMHLDEERPEGVENESGGVLNGLGVGWL